MSRTEKCILFDWGETLMQVFPQYTGAMMDWPRVAPVDYAPEVLAELYPKTRLAVATNARDSDEAQIRGALKRVELDGYLDFIFCFRTIGYLKPDIEYYQYILNRLELRTEQVVMVGDEWNADILGANQAGLRAIWLNERTPEQRKSEQYQTIHSLLELPQALEQWKFIENDVCAYPV
jgi:putative hydrolase of the HAD superfamily